MSADWADLRGVPIMARLTAEALRVRPAWELAVVRGLIQEIETRAAEPIFPAEPTLCGEPIRGLEPAAEVRERALEAAQRLFLGGEAGSMLEALQLVQWLLWAAAGRPE